MGWSKPKRTKKRNEKLMQQVRDVGLADAQILDLILRLDRVRTDRETRYLAEESINAFSELLELWQFLLEKGWSADKLIQLTNMISALRK